MSEQKPFNVIEGPKPAKARDQVSTNIKDAAAELRKLADALENGRECRVLAVFFVDGDPFVHSLAWSNYAETPAGLFPEMIGNLEVMRAGLLRDALDAMERSAGYE